MTQTTDRAAYEAEELRGLAVGIGATREYMPELGIMVWRVPPWVCPYCFDRTGNPDAEVQEGCPDRLARHGPVK